MEGGSILFICGSLEPGRDGVGDYTRRLASILQQSGNRVMLVATHDKRSTRVKTEVQIEGLTEISTLRIPYATTAAARLTWLQKTVDEFEPAWISVQYVPHGYNKYGLPLGLIYSLARLRTTAARHLMFHELWITPGKKFRAKEQLISTLEKRAVRWLVGSGFHPDLVHTHLPVYGERLRAKGAQVKPLPLFANIGEWNAGRTRADPRRFKAAFFSQLDTPVPVIGFLGELSEHLRKSDVQLEISLLGGGPERVNQAAEKIAAALPAALVRPVGFLSAEEVSRHLAVTDLGITPVLHHEIGKSGTVAAFLTHRVAVAAPVVTEKSPSFYLPELNRAVFSQFTARALRQAQEAAAGLDIKIISAITIADTLANDLTAARPSLPFLTSTAPAALPE